MIRLFRTSTVQHKHLREFDVVQLFRTSSNYCTASIKYFARVKLNSCYLHNAKYSCTVVRTCSKESNHVKLVRCCSTLPNLFELLKLLFFYFKLSRVHSESSVWFDFSNILKLDRTTPNSCKVLFAYAVQWFKEVQKSRTRNFFFERVWCGSTLPNLFELLYSISKAYLARVRCGSTLPNLFKLL